MKEARLQNPVLMNKNRILRRVFAEDEMARHIEVHILYYMADYVDAAAIGGKLRRSLQSRVDKAEKSAEVIVVFFLIENEGLNVKRLELYCNSPTTLKVVS